VWRDAIVEHVSTSPKIAIFFLGGTISMAGHAGAVVRLGAAELIDSVPALAELAVEVDAIDFRRIPSACLRSGDILELISVAEQAVAGGAVGIVVVQGTDTIEETAYLIDLLWRDDAPIVVTGAMRNPKLAGADGPANLLAAAAVAASAQCRGLGALVVLNDEIHAARHVAKRHSTSPAAFVSPNAGPVGRIAEGAPLLTMTLARRRPLGRPQRIDAVVALVSIVFDDAGVLLHGIEDRCDGVVIAGFGVGHVPDRLAERLGDIARHIPVVLASRTGAGPVLSRTYGFAGSETDLQARGLSSAGMLDPLKARMLLSVLLANGADRPAIAAAFAHPAG
jgi:L-asparaginase